MAKKKPYGVGKTVSEIISGISRNIGRVTETTMRQAVSRLSSAMNKRLDRAAKKGERSPALDEVARSGGRFSAKGKDMGGLKSEFLRLKNFFKDPTSTREGWKKVQKRAHDEAIKKGVLKPPTPPAPAQASEAPPPPPPKIIGGPIFETEEEKKAFQDLFGGEGIHGMGQTKGQWSGWQPLPGWTWNEETRSWEHPDYGSGWLPYEEEGGGFLDPITGEIVGNQARSIHDYDATLDPKVWGDGTETGEIWRMVDSIARMDSRFSRQLSYANPLEDPRMMLFNAIDDAWSNDPAMSFEAARDSVVDRLDKIYEAAQEHIEAARERGSFASTRK